MPSLEQIRFWRIRAPSFSWTWWKWTLLSSIAECTLIGTAIRPKVIVPFQIERGMGVGYPRRMPSQPFTRPPCTVSMEGKPTLEKTMAPNDLDDQLIKYLTDAHSIEQQALEQMKRAPDIAGDPAISEQFSQHLTETEQHEQRVRERLEELGRRAPRRSRTSPAR